MKKEPRSFGCWQVILVKTDFDSARTCISNVMMAWQTCDDFIAALADANSVDLTAFKRWYEQAGTPS